MIAGGEEAKGRDDAIGKSDLKQVDRRARGLMDKKRCFGHISMPSRLGVG